MDRVVNFLSSLQHKVVFFFHDDQRRVRCVAVVSRRKGSLFLIELRHGGVALETETNHSSENTAASSLVLAETSRYAMTPVDPSMIPSPTRDKMEKTSSVIVPRLAAAAVEQGAASGVRQGIFMHPYFIMTSSTGLIETAWRMGDFEWSLDTMGCLLLMRLEDFHENQHTIHEKVDRLLHHQRSFAASSVEEFIPTLRHRWRIPGDTKLTTVLLDRVREMVDYHEKIDKLNSELVDLYGVLHDVSLETLNVEEQISSVENIVFHQMLDYGQQKRRLHKTLDELRLLEKHVLEVLIALRFRYEDTCMDTLYLIHKLSSLLSNTENVIQEYTQSQQKKKSNLGI
jgi:hypothetical protein